MNPYAAHGRGTINNVYLLIGALCNIVHRIDAAGTPVRFGSDKLGPVNPYDFDGQRKVVAEAIQVLLPIIKSVPTSGEQHRGGHHHRYRQGGTGPSSSSLSSSSFTSGVPSGGSQSHYEANEYDY